MVDPGVAEGALALLVLKEVVVLVKAVRHRNGGDPLVQVASTLRDTGTAIREMAKENREAHTSMSERLVLLDERTR